MNKEKSIKLFKDQRVRVHWDEDQEKWFFSIIDAIEILTESPRPRKYWNALKSKLQEEGSELSQNMGQFKMLAQDGKMRLTDVADTEQLFRLIQSVPSKKAEPFKLWLAKVGRERIDEIEDPEIGIERLMETYLKKGYSKNWINQRLKSIEVRKELTDEWDSRGIQKGQEYAILTNEIIKAWTGFTIKEYKNFKDLKKENLRDNMTNLELVLNMLAETSTTELSKKQRPKTLRENKNVARKGGAVAGTARKDLEKKLGESVISPLSAKELGKRDSKKLKE